MPCLNCDQNNNTQDYFCCWSCETCYLMRCEATAYFKGQLKYPEYLENRDHYLLTGIVKNKNLRPLQYKPSFLC